jgi:hypothetical protein
VVHILVKGRIVASGGPELAGELETTGYATWTDDDDVEEVAVSMPDPPPIPSPTRSPDRGRCLTAGGAGRGDP